MQNRNESVQSLLLDAVQPHSHWRAPSDAVSLAGAEPRPSSCVLDGVYWAEWSGNDVHISVTFINSCYSLS